MVLATMIVLSVLLPAVLLPDHAWASLGTANDCPDSDTVRQNTDSIDSLINAYICPVSRSVSKVVFVSLPFVPLPLVVAVLFLAGVFLTFYLRCINLRGLKTAWDIAWGKADDPKAPGEITHFQALSTALSGTVGLGNIGGVAAAISVGGPGATFWMIIAGFFSMATKFCECTLGHKYRQVAADGTVSGGAMHYLSRGLAEHGRPRLGRLLATAFAVFCVGGAIGAGNMFQANQAFEQISFLSNGALAEGGHGWKFGVALALLVAVVIIGGIRLIARVTETIVPFMGLLYITACLVILVIHADALPAAIVSIFTEAFNPRSAYGGMIGVMIWGIQRATFSNESGMGSAPIAYAAVRSRHSFSVGYISLLEPLIDTIIVCTMTALVIITSGVYLDNTGIRGVQLTSSAFASAVDWFPYVLSVAICLFAFSTLITWSYYGLKSWTYLFGEKSGTLFKIIFCLFIVVGASASLTEVILFSDSMLFLMTVPNIIGLIFLVPTLKRHLPTSRHFYRDTKNPVGKGNVGKGNVAKKSRP